MGEGAIGHDVYRLRDLVGRQRWVAAAVAAALSLAPALALVRYLPAWFPAGDPALMGLRALDVGTSRTTLIAIGLGRTGERTEKVPRDAV